MSLALGIKALAEGIAADVKLLTAHQGDLSTLNTTAKDSLVHAINELFSQLAGAGVHIDDTKGAGDKTVTYSADKIVSAINAGMAVLKSDLLGGVDAAWDTFKELRDQMVADETMAVTFSQQLGKRVSVSDVQTFTTAEKAQGRANIDAVSTTEVGDTTTDFLAAYNAAKA